MNPIEKLMGFIMNGIYECLYFIGVKDVGWNIVLSTVFFTILIYMLLLPMTIKQQKFSRISAVMNPEIQKIQEKYKGKTDQASMMKMQEETKAVYKKYGSSPSSGCLGSLIQLPFLFALWPVMRNVSEHVGRIDGDKIHTVLGIVVSGNETTPAATPSSLIKSGDAALIVVAILIPLLVGVTQIASTKISQKLMQSRSDKKEENALPKQMNIMMTIMPLMSVFMCFSMEVVLGLYWIVSAVVRTIQQIIINKVLDKKPIEELVKENMEKAARKNARKQSQK